MVALNWEECWTFKTACAFRTAKMNSPQHWLCNWLCNWWCNGQSAVGVHDATVSRELQICVAHDAYDDCFIDVVYQFAPRAFDSCCYGWSAMLKASLFPSLHSLPWWQRVVLSFPIQKKTHTLKPHQLGTTTHKCHYSAKQPAKCTAERTGNERNATIAAAKIRIRGHL
jgi:hypothetical protein